MDVRFCIASSSLTIQTYDLFLYFQDIYVKPIKTFERFFFEIIAELPYCYITYVASEINIKFS
jgi:hypothetical protein